MDDNKYQLIGLSGFVASGGFFTAVAIQSGDTLSVIGSTLWIASCVVWAIPLLKRR